MKKPIVSAVAAATLLSGAPAVNAEGISANVDLATDYRFRGISQTDREPAIQGGFDWSHKSGFYLGTWGSNVAFAGSLELDAYAGFSNKFLAGDKGSYDVGVLGYFYPGGNKTTIEDPEGSGNFTSVDVSYYEIYGSLGYDFGALSGTVGVNYSPEYTFSSGTFWYPYVDLNVPLPKDFGIVAHYGYNSIDDNDRFGTPDYSDWKVGVTKSWLGLDWSLDYIDTDLSKSECFGGSKVCDATAVLAIAKSF